MSTKLRSNVVGGTNAWQRPSRADLLHVVTHILAYTVAVRGVRLSFTRFNDAGVNRHVGTNVSSRLASFNTKAYEDNRSSMVQGITLTRQMTRMDLQYSVTFIGRAIRVRRFQLMVRRR